MAERRYESAGLDARKLGLTVLAGVVLLPLLCALVWWGYRAYQGEAPEARSPQRVSRAPRAAPLEEHPLQAGKQLNASQRWHLRSTGWVDRSAGIAHIPIDEAMRTLVRDSTEAGND